MKATKSPYNLFGFYSFLFTIVFSSAWVIYFLLIQNSIDLGELDDTSAQTSKVASLSSQDQTKPWVFTEAFVTHGSKIYKAQCALCHGAKGLGDGTPGLVPPPRNLVKGKWTQGGSSKALFVTLQKGIAGSAMVSFKHLPVVDRWALVHYIRAITKNKIPDNIKELEEFAKNNL